MAPVSSLHFQQVTKFSNKICRYCMLTFCPQVKIWNFSKKCLMIIDHQITSTNPIYPLLYWRHGAILRPSKTVLTEVSCKWHILAIAINLTLSSHSSQKPAQPPCWFYPWLLQRNSAVLRSERISWCQCHISWQYVYLVTHLSRLLPLAAPGGHLQQWNTEISSDRIYVFFACPDNFMSWSCNFGTPLNGRHIPRGNTETADHLKLWMSR
jgi:hypothetical protein